MSSRSTEFCAAIIECSLAIRRSATMGFDREKGNRGLVSTEKCLEEQFTVLYLGLMRAGFEEKRKSLRQKNSSHEPPDHSRPSRTKTSARRRRHPATERASNWRRGKYLTISERQFGFHQLCCAFRNRNCSSLVVTDPL